MSNFELTDKEQRILVIALGELEAMVECPGNNPLLGRLAKDIRLFLRVRNITPAEIKDLVIKLGVTEKTVFSGVQGLQ